MAYKLGYLRRTTYPQRFIYIAENPAIINEYTYAANEMNSRKQYFYAFVPAVFVLLYYSDVFCTRPSDGKTLIRWKSREEKVTETSLEKTQETVLYPSIQGTGENLRKSKQLTKTNFCSSAPPIQRNGHFSSSQAKVIRKRYDIPENQCLFSNIPFENILSQDEIDKSDGFPAQYWQLVKDSRVCEPPLITGEKLDVSCRDEKNPVKYFWSGKYKGDEHTEGCEARCQPTENKAEADFLVNAGSKPISKIPGKTQYTVRYAVESIFMDGTPSNHDITMDMSPYSNVPMLYIPDEFYNKLVAMKPPSV